MDNENAVETAEASFLAAVVKLKKAEEEAWEALRKPNSNVVGMWEDRWSKIRGLAKAAASEWAILKEVKD